MEEYLDDTSFLDALEREITVIAINTIAVNSNILRIFIYLSEQIEYKDFWSLVQIDSHSLVSNVYTNMPVPAIVSIEGNIGSGKSTFINYLSKLFDKKEVVIVPEPVKEWEGICDKDGKSMLVHFYEDQTRNAFSFQMMVYISRLACLKKAIKSNPWAKIIITERCLETDRNVFAKMLYHEGKIREVDYQIYCRWFDEFHKNLIPSYYIYIRASARICTERIAIRSRDGESGIPYEYLEKCGGNHDEWLSGLTNVYTCDGSMTTDIGHPIWTKHIQSIMCNLNTTYCRPRKLSDIVNYII